MTHARFLSILNLTVLLLAFTPSLAAKEQSWYERCLVGMEVGPTGAQFGSDPTDVGYAANFNGVDVVRACLAANSEYVVIWARDGEYAYYDSKVMPKCPGLGERDVLRETMIEARKHNLPVIAYCVVQANGHHLREHPEWSMLDHQGNALGRVCLNSDYYDFVRKLVEEMLAYGIDGFHIDMLDQGFGPPYGCWCERCKSLFQTEYGQAMPTGATWDESWDRMLEFRYATSQRFERNLREHIRKLNPKTTVDYNYHGYPPFSFEVGQRPVQHANNSDFVTGETGVWGFSALNVGLTSRFLAATNPGAIFQVAMQRGVRMYHDQTTRPLNDIRWELFTLLSHGTRVTIVDKTAYDGWLDPVGYERVGQAFKEALAKREHFGQPVLAEVGLYYSARTRDWWAREDAAKYQLSFYGAHKSLVFDHIPFEILLSENITTERLNALPVVLVPNAAILEPSEIAMFRKYVENGGNLIFTGQSGQFDKMGNPANETTIAELIGAKSVRRLDALDHHVSLSGEEAIEPLRDGIRADWPFLVKGRATVYEPTTAQPYGSLHEPHRTVRQLQGKEGFEWPMSAGAVIGPAVLINTIGKGRVLTFAASPDFAAATEHHITEARRLLSNAIRLLNPDPIIRIKAPANVETVVSRDPDSLTLRVHLIGYLSTPGSVPERNRPFILPGLVEDTPMYRGEIKFRDHIKQAHAFDEKTEMKNDNSTLSFVVENVHETIIIETR